MSEPSLLKQLRKNVRDTVLQVPDIERKVKNCTSNDKWGPHAQDMAELARASFSYTDCPLMMNAIWKRLDEPGKHWRHVYKALLLLEYLIKNGSEQIPGEAKVHLLQIKTLKDFQYIDEDRKDVGLSVRERAKKLAELISDDELIASERAKAAKNAGKYTGVSSDDYHSGNAPRHTGGDRNGNDSGDENGAAAGEGATLDDDDEEKPKPKPRKATAGTTAAAKPRKETAGGDSRPRAPSGGASSAPKPAAAPAPSASASLFDAFASAPTPAPALDPFGGSAFGAPAPAADPFGGSPFGAPAPAAASPFGAAAPFGATPFGAPAPAATASPFGVAAFGAPAPAAASPFGAAAAPFGAFGAPAPAAAAAPQPAAAAAADPFGSFGGFQSAPTPAAATDKGLAVDPLLNKTKNLWDLDSLGKKEDTTAVDHKRTVPMGAISTTGPARKASAAPAPSWATAGAAPALTPQQQQQQQQMFLMQQQQQQQFGFGGFSG